jgi:CDP-6-deoxy-D-xylo-4-hexulose-3-dehydrase
MKKIVYGKNVYGSEEINAVNKALSRTTQMSKYVSLFEKKISNKFSKKFGIMVNSGTSAIMLALKVLKLKAGDEVIIPCLNFGTAVSSLMLCELKPILVDINLYTLQIDEALIEKKITKKTKALLIPNLIGNIPNWEILKKISKKYNLKLIEDSADTLGATYKGRPTGYYSDASITSFYGSHVISCAGNGGMLALNNKSEYDKARTLRSWGRSSSSLKDSENIKKRLNISLKGYDYDKKFVFSDIGYNFEPSEIGAAFGLEQLKKLKIFSQKRQIHFEYHYNFFNKLKEYFIVPKILANVRTNFLAYPIILKENKKYSRKKLQIFLENCGIQTRPIFTGNLLRHPAFSSVISSRNKLNGFPNSDYIMKNGILIGCHQGLTIKNLKYIHNAILKFIQK